MMSELKWTAKKLRAAYMVARGAKLEEVATAVGVSRTTVYNWRNSPEFQLKVAEFLQDEERQLKQEIINNITEKIR